MNGFNERILAIQSRKSVIGKLSPNVPLEAVRASTGRAKERAVELASSERSGNGWKRTLRAVEPLEVWEGCLETDQPYLSEKVRGLTARSEQFPNAFAAGTVDYDGRFEFALYEGNAEPPKTPEAENTAEWGNFQPKIPREMFREWVSRAQEYITAGDIYQVNLTRQFVCEQPGSAWEFYQALCEQSPAPYAAFLQQRRRTIISSSPECFLRMNRDQIETKPIKGTRPRGFSAKDDAEKRTLYGSAKEQAELLMITDLMRNDLGKVCQFGSVFVLQPAAVETFAQVHHLVSTVNGRLRAEVDHVQALQACFPGGSITGAPKKRAMEIIAEIETAPRGLYTGAIGYFHADGTSEFSMAIRTVIVEGRRAHFHVGAGIVADSDPAAEFEETNQKAKGILLAASQLQRK